jgi:superfamily II DNA/RNA helicase
MIKQSKDHDLMQDVHMASRFRLLDLNESLEPDSASNTKGNSHSKLEDLRLTPEVQEAMRSTILAHTTISTKKPTSIKPTPIQSLAVTEFQKIFQSETPSRDANHVHPVLLAAETGSGKTMAYLAPTFDQLRRDELHYQETVEAYEKALIAIESRKHVDSKQPSEAGSTQAEESPLDSSSDATPEFVAPIRPIPLRRPGYPRAIVLVPSMELLSQVGKVAKDMSHVARVRVVTLSTSTSDTHAKRILEDPVDLLITTPGSLIRINANKKINFADTRILVIDEADFVLDQGFLDETRQVIQEVGCIAAKRETSRALVFVTASVPESLPKTLNELVSTGSQPLHVAKTTALHQVSTRCKYEFVDVARQHAGNKHAALLAVLRTHHFEQTLQSNSNVVGSSTMIFCNKVSAVDNLATYLQSKQVECLRLTGALTVHERASIWEQFCRDPNKILICTDVASRGLDPPAFVQLIVSYDFPTSPLDYLHRAGRTARAGGYGRMVALVTHKTKGLAKALQQRLKLRSSLGSSSASIAKIFKRK